MHDTWFGTTPIDITEPEAAAALSKIRHPDGHWIVLAKTQRDLSTAEFLAALDGIMSDPDLGPQTPAIWDFRETDFSSHTAQSCLSCAMTLMRVPERKGAKRAFVVCDDLGFGVLRLLQQYMEGLAVEEAGNVQIFDTMDAALAWL